MSARFILVCSDREGRNGAAVYQLDDEDVATIIVALRKLSIGNGSSKAKEIIAMITENK